MKKGGSSLEPPQLSPNYEMPKMTNKNQVDETLIDTGEEPEDMLKLEQDALLSQIKVQADLLGVNYASNIGLETLSERVRAFKEAQGAAIMEEATASPAPVELLETTTGLAVPDDIEQQYAIFYAKQIVRVSITCVNPAKSELESDLYTVFSSSIGRVSQVIPYQAPNGHHLPRCLADFLKGKTYTAFKPTKRKAGENGCDREHFETPEFIIRALPPLDAEEFNRIIQRQDRTNAAQNIEDY